MVLKSSFCVGTCPEDSYRPMRSCPSKVPKKVFAGLFVFKLMWGNPGALFEKIKEFHCPGPHQKLRVPAPNSKDLNRKLKEDCPKKNLL